jgi:hypothetical protein
MLITAFSAFTGSAATALADTLGHHGGILDRGARQQDGEFGAAQAAHLVRIAQLLLAHVDHRLQHHVAGRMAVAVVDALELVEVEHNQRGRHAGRRASAIHGVSAW